MPRSAILDQRRLAEAVPARTVETLHDFLDDVHGRIARRAYELFEAQGALGGRELEDWLTAERELFWQPSVDVTEKDGMLTIEMALPGMKPDDVDVQLTEHQVLVCGERSGASADGEKEPREEAPHAQLCHCIEVSATLQPAAARARLHDGVLKIEVPLAKEQAPTVVPVEEGETRRTA